MTMPKTKAKSKPETQDAPSTFGGRRPSSCSWCGTSLELKKFCHSCKGWGGWGDWLETGVDTCETCDGTGEATDGFDAFMDLYCPRCHLIYATNAEAIHGEKGTTK